MDNHMFQVLLHEEDVDVDVDVHEEPDVFQVSWMTMSTINKTLTHSNLIHSGQKLLVTISHL